MIYIKLGLQTGYKFEWINRQFKNWYGAYADWGLQSQFSLLEYGLVGILCLDLREIGNKTLSRQIKVQIFQLVRLCAWSVDRLAYI